MLTSISIIELIDYVRKHIKLIIICIIIAGLLGQNTVSKQQSYSASVVIKYTYTGAAEGKDPKNGKLDVYEIMSPIVIENAISALKLNTGVEKIRNKIVITPFIDATTKQKQKALTEKGEDFEYFPTEYTVTYSYPGYLGSQYGKIFLNKLLESYDEYFRQEYTGQRKIQDAFYNINYDNYDYMEICELFEGQLDDINKTLKNLATENPYFRSSKTGLTFNDLSYYFNNLWATDYSKLYAKVRMGNLSKNEEMLLKKYQYRVEKLNLESSKKQVESNTSYSVLLDFYKEYKEGKRANDLGSTLKESNLNGTTGDQIVKDKNLNNIITTYDEIMLKYVDSGVAASNAYNDIIYYQNLMNDYMNDPSISATKVESIEAVNKLIDKIDAQFKNYIEIANNTLSDYNMYKGTQYITFLTPVETKAAVSVRTIMMFSLAAGLGLGIILAIMIELIKKLKEKADMQLRVERISMINDGVIPIDTSKLTPIEQKLFNQAVNKFNDFELYYQPIVNKDNVFVGAEVLTRWKDEEFGMIMPAEFLPIAEKYDIMVALGEWILRKACIQCRKWNDDGAPDLWLSINFSMSQISGPMFIDGIFKALNETKVDAKNIILEVSNGGALTNIEEASKKLTALKTIGVKVSLDNFGEVDSSVDALSKLPLDLVKLSRESVQNIDRNINTLNFISNIVSMADLLGFKACAEGVEYNYQAKKLLELGVDYLQGYYFAKPVNATEFLKLYDNHGNVKS